ncbi:MAG TPA: carbohydrate ABC transporter permease [Firmicutes bacterium]|nr:carbohydrate ABC transporter permease [Bacillota bacterium]
MEKLKARFTPENRQKFKEDAQHFVRVHKPQTILFVIFRHALLIGLCFVILYPILYMLSNAFKPTEQFSDPSVIWIPRSLTLDNFKIALQLVDLGKVLLDTLLAAIVPALISTVTCMLVAYGLSRFNFRGRGLIFALVILTIIVPSQTMTTSLYLQYRFFDPLGIISLINLIPGVELNVNLIGTPLVTILPAIFAMGLRAGLYIFIYRQFFLSLPKELEEAASIDGCNAYSTFLRIVVPTTKNIVLTVILLSVVWYWNDYYTPSMFLGSKMEVISVTLSQFQDRLANIHNLGLGLDIATSQTQVQAMCLIAILPLVVLYIILQKNFSESIESSGLTGM